MEPLTKKRRLAPKIEPAPVRPGDQFIKSLDELSHARRLGSRAQSQPHQQAPPHQSPKSQAAQQQQPAQQPTQSQSHLQPQTQQRKDFYAFAHHLQDAAMLFKRQSERSVYSSVSALLLRWEDDASLDRERELVELETVLRDKFRYRVGRWNIPSVANPGTKLGVQMAKFLEQAKPNHLLLIYYAGHGYQGPDGRLYWACNGQEDAPRLKWDGVRCLFEDAQPDILLLLDTCSLIDHPPSGSHGMKQAIVSRSVGANSRKTAGARSFSSLLTDTLVKLCATDTAFTVKKLYDDMLEQKRSELSDALLISEKAPAATAGASVDPVLFTLTPGNVRNISLSALPPDLIVDGPGSMGEAGRTSSHDQLLDPKSVMDLKFDEDRVLICTTFLGDASADLSNFHEWLRNTPPLASRISVEGMFLGPNTTLLISMPQEVYDLLQGNEICLFLGQISSHNMIHLYHTLMGSAGPHRVPLRNEETRMRVGASDAAKMQAKFQTDMQAEMQAEMQPDKPSDVGCPDQDVQATDTKPPAVAIAQGHAVPGTLGAKQDVEDSAEMKEAAEQLKALKHLRHRSDEAQSQPPTTPAQHRTVLPEESPTRYDDILASFVSDMAVDEPTLLTSPHPGRIKAHDHPPHQQQQPAAAQQPSQQNPQRRPLVRKTATQCMHCSHVPFKDSSSLRKHIAAAHTRPFPCAFSFAGCTSTFGSKNEWKRHMASQHLCLTYYRCSECPRKTPEGRDEFNRKDLFTQHLRRMHAPYDIKKTLVKADSQPQVEWENHVKEMQKSCLVTRRQAPQRSACPKPDCQTTFEGLGSWDEWTEHVGKHMEKGEGQQLGVDGLLAHWALEEGIIEQTPGGYRFHESANGGVSNGAGPLGAGEETVPETGHGDSMGNDDGPWPYPDGSRPQAGGDSVVGESIEADLKQLNRLQAIPMDGGMEVDDT